MCYGRSEIEKITINWRDEEGAGKRNERKDVWSGALKNRYDSHMLYNAVRWTDQRRQIYRQKADPWLPGARSRSKD